MAKFGRRNIALLTIAPTGTTSLMTQTTSGIEPIFSVFYKRKRKVNPNDKDVKITFRDEVGDCWEEFLVFHHKFVDWLRLNGYDPNAMSPG
jgi:ribonucleoside-diphosphate reductase alpha chain